MRAEQPTVQPHVGGEKSAADPQHDTAGMVWARKLGAIPDRLAALRGRELAGHLDGFPAGAAADGQALRLAFAERHPDRFPSGELTPPRGALRQRHEQRVAHCVFTKAPSAVEQKSIGRAMERAKDSVWRPSTRARMLPPKPAPMMRAP